MTHRPHCPLMGCTGCLPDEDRLPDVHDYAAAQAAALPPVDFTGVEARLRDEYRAALAVPPPHFERIEDTA